MLALLVLLAAVLASGFTYAWLEPSPELRGLPGLRRNLVPFLARSLGWAALGLLLVDWSCRAPARSGTPLVLLDGSLSMVTDSGRWTEARDTAHALGQVQLFGDEREAGDSLPNRGRSQLLPALSAAAASDRPIVVVTDAELDDVSEIPADLLNRASIRVFPRRPGADLAVTRVDAPARVVVGDSVPVSAVVRGFGGADSATATVEVRQGDRVLARRTLDLRREAALTVTLPSAALRPGANLLTVALVGAADAEPRDDARQVLIEQSAAPGVVLLAAPGDWDSRFLYRTLVEVAELPVRGYIQLEPGQWRSYRDLAPVPAAQVRRAAAGADLLILYGSPAEGQNSRARARWLWRGGGSAGAMAGDWYLNLRPVSPVSGALLGLPVDSFPPATEVLSIEADSAGWVALGAQLGRRGGERPVYMGRETGGRREVTVAASGLWRWAFRGGSSEQGYRGLIAATATWLLGGTDSVTGRARPARPVVANGQPVTFEWMGAGRPAPLEIVWSGDATRRDTLRFDGAGRARTWLPVGTYQYRLEGGGAGTVAVEQYSDEWLPRERVVETHDAARLAAGRESRARGWVWLFALGVLGLAGEWLSRRQLGLR